MQYLIDNRVLFTPNDGILRIQDNPDISVSLTLTASRLLCYLVQHEGLVIKRDELLENVWEAYGISASGNSLNQHLSILRRKLTELGVSEDVIKTIPRVGFIANHIKHISGFVPDTKESTPESNSLEEFPPDSNSPAEKDNRPKAKILRRFPVKFYTMHFSRNLWINVLGLSAILLLGGLLKLQQTNVAAESANLHKMGVIGECQIYSVYLNSANMKEKKLAVVKDRIEKYNIHCSSPSDFYIVNISDNIAFGKSGVMFMSYCTSNNEGLVDSCRDYYEPF